MIFLGISDDVLKMSPMSNFQRNFVSFGHVICLKVRRNSLFSPRICILIGYVNLQFLKCDRLCVVEILRRNHRKIPIYNSRPV